MGNRVVVLGGGPGGYVAAVRCAQLGAEVTLIERDKLGGTCLNCGCIPSKILKTASERMEMIRRSGEFGIELTGEVHVDMNVLLTRKERILEMERWGIEGLLKKNNIELLQGEGHLTERGTLMVRMGDGSENPIAWDRLILATGSRPASLPSLPFDGKDIISSDDALSIKEIPRSILIVGGGVIGCEFASIFSALGVQVTIVEALDRLLPLPSVDEECSKTLQREMKKRKIQVYTGKIVEGIEYREGGLVAKLVSSPLSQLSKPEKGAPLFVRADKLLVCAGRVPNTAALGLESMGVLTDSKGWIQVNERLETTAPAIYAIGDVLGPENVMLAHVASIEGIVAAETCMGADRKMNYAAAPGAIFTTPEVADVGLTEYQARKQGIEVLTETVLFRTNSKAHVLGEIAGFVKIVSEEETGRILGVHMIGPHVTDLIAEGTLAVRLGCSAEQLSLTIHAHPTLSEVMLETAYKLLGRPIHG